MMLPFVALLASTLVLTPDIKPGTEDATAAIQSCLDQAEAAGGGTVYLGPGEYRISTLALGENVTLKLAGGIEKAVDGYTDEVRQRAMDPKVSAIIRTTGKSVIDMFIFNMHTPGWVTNGASRVTVSGGVFDCEGKMKVLAFICAKGARVENMLVKDLKNDHAFQFSGCADMVVTNCLFAGFRYDPGDPTANVVTRETIQFEPTTPGAICRSATSPIRCKPEYRVPSRNGAIVDCWFGPSENLGSQMQAYGHHVKSRSCDGVVIRGNVFANIRHCALRLANDSNVLVEGNYFCYTKPVTKLSQDAAAVLLWGENRLQPGEKGYMFLNNHFETCIDFNLPRYVFAPGREQSVTLDPVMTVTLSFDDGTRDQLKAAALLEKYGWRGCFNIITDLVGVGKHMTWDEIRDLKRRGHEIASHTASHPSLVQLIADGKREEARADLIRSRDAILAHLGEAPRYVCHPYIRHNDETDMLIRETGMLPSGCVRYNHGTGTKAGTPTGVGDYIDRKRREGKLKVDLLFHGVERGGGWKPLESIDDFEDALKEIKAREQAGIVRVLHYDAFMREGTDARIPLNTNAADVVRFFSEHVYGVRPDLSGLKKTCRVKDLGHDPVLKARRREVTLNTLTPWGETNFTAVALEPEHAAETRVPCFVYLSFQSPAEMLARPDDATLKPWRWPAKDILARGFATVAVYYEDIFPDDPPQVAAWGRDPSRQPNGWGAISTWALAASRIMDWLETAPGIDASRVAIVGHSRLGKTALWTGATDARFAYAVINDSGCMGARMSTRNLPGGETIEIITRRFPHWFAPTFRTHFAERDASLPFDQHWLVAALAPRLVTVGSAEDDRWACPSGEHASLESARDAWGENWRRCHYHIRPGGHDITPVDWADYMDFAEAHGWKGAK